VLQFADLQHSKTELVQKNSVMRSDRSTKDLSWVVYAEVFLLVMSFTYVSAIFVDAALDMSEIPEHLEVSPVAVDAEQVAAALGARTTFVRALGIASGKKFRSDETTDKKVCEDGSALSTVLTTLVIAFMAGGFTNMERIQGLPIP